MTLSAQAGARKPLQIRRKKKDIYVVKKKTKQYKPLIGIKTKAFDLLKSAKKLLNSRITKYAK